MSYRIVEESQVNACASIVKHVIFLPLWICKCCRSKKQSNSEKKQESKKESPERDGEQQRRRSTSFPSPFVLRLSKQVEVHMLLFPIS